MPNARILVVEDDAAISDIVCSTLASEGYKCTPAYSGSEAKLVLASNKVVESPSVFPFDLVICDLMLPGLSGEEIVDLIRRQSIVPILVTSAKSEVSNRITLLRQGVDDYLVKPFDLDELVARVEALLRRSQPGRDLSGHFNGMGHSAIHEGRSEEERFMGEGQHASGQQTPDNQVSSEHLSSERLLKFGAWTLSEEKRVFSVAGKEIKLTRTEFDVLAVLMRHPQKVFTKRELYEAVWHEESFVEEKAINTHISNIRSKLKESGTNSYLETVWGIGFKLADL